MNRLRTSFLALLALLSACSLKTLTTTPGGELLFDICQNALDQSSDKKAYQGYDGWFFFDLDLEETHALLGQANCIVALSTRLKTQGVTLVAVPVSSRAVVRPDRLYLQDPLQATFDSRETEAIYTDFVNSLRAGGVTAVDVVATTPQAVRHFSSATSTGRPRAPTWFFPKQPPRFDRR